MSMFCKFRHRGKSNVFIVISVGIVGAREWFMRFYWCCHFGFIVCRVGDYWICGFCMVNGLFSLCEHIVICEYWNSVLFVS